MEGSRIVARQVPKLSVFRAHTLLARLTQSIAPAVAAGAIGATHEGVLAGLVLFVSLLVVALLIRGSRYPLHLMPVARYAFHALVPAAGVCAALLIGPLVGEPISAAVATASLLAAWVIAAFGVWLESSFEHERPVRIAVIGSPQVAADLAEELQRAGVGGYLVVGVIGSTDARSPGDPPVLGSLEGLREIVQSSSIDLLVPAPSDGRLKVFEHAAEVCLDLPVRMIEATALYERLLGHVPIGTINSAWFQYLMHPGYQPGSPASKRAFDIGAVLLAAPLVIPLLAVCALLIRLREGGPVLHRQRRVGAGGREFEILKLRTMRPSPAGAEARLCLADDERIFPIGGWLRRTHLDELPQLLNVLRGDMTLVGPRPEQPSFVMRLQREFTHYGRRHLVKPGLSGWAQVRCGYCPGRSEVAWKVCHDLYYLKHRSLLFDVLIAIESARTLVADRQYGLSVPNDRFVLGAEAGIVLAEEPRHAA